MDVLRRVVPALSGLISRRFGCYGVFRDAGELYRGCVTVAELSRIAAIRPGLASGRARDAREDVGVTVAEMADAISSTIPVASQAVSYWELGRRVSGAARALACARALAALTHGCCP
jgi:hypothetical protein